jgi:hypothetical protein
MAVFLVLVTAIAHSLEMEYISPQQKQRLVDEFEASKLAKTDILTGKKWSCDMYGVRSRLQVQRDVKLYSLSKNPSGAYANNGAQVVSEYQFKNGVFSGKNSKFEDQLRITANGRLMSRLSVLKPSPVVIAYSVCKAI